MSENTDDLATQIFDYAEQARRPAERDSPREKAREFFRTCYEQVKRSGSIPDSGREKVAWRLYATTEEKRALGDVEAEQQARELMDELVNDSAKTKESTEQILHDHVKKYR